MRKKEIREARKAQKSEQNKEKAVRLVDNLTIPKEPKMQFLSADLKKQACVHVALQDLDIPKQIRSEKNGSRFELSMSWCARKGDIEGAWDWNESRKWSDAEWLEEIVPGMNKLEGMQWKEIQNQSSDTGHRLHHDHEIADLCQQAQQRWLELDFEEFETLFRFRFGNTKRAWGIILLGHFFMVWWERHHKIYPTTK